MALALLSIVTLLLLITQALIKNKSREWELGQLYLWGEHYDWVNQERHCVGRENAALFHKRKKTIATLLHAIMWWNYI